MDAITDPLGVTIDREFTTMGLRESSIRRAKGTFAIPAFTLWDMLDCK